MHSDWDHKVNVDDDCYNKGKDYSMKQPKIYIDNYVNYDKVSAAPPSTSDAPAAVTVDESLLKIIGPGVSKP